MTVVSSTTYSGAAAPSSAPTAAPVAAPAAAAAPAAPPAAAPAAAPAAPEAAPLAPVAPLSLEAAETPPAEVDPVKALDTSAPIVYEKTGDAGLDMALGFLGKNGYDVTHPAMVAAGKGDFAMLKADLAAKEVPGAAEFVALAEQSWTKVSGERNAREAADRAAIMESVGGEKAWAAIQQWGAANAEPAERAAIGAALSAGGFVAKATARYLAESYAKASGTTVEPASAVRDGAAPTSGRPTSGALSPTGYMAAIAELKSRIGSTNLDAHPDYHALVARRRAFKG